MRHAKAIVDKLRHPESFLGPVLTLVSGTAVAHGITAGALIVLARLYSPAEFGVLGVFTAIYFSLSVISCLRFDIAIALPRDDGEAASLLSLSLLSALLVAAVVALGLALVPASVVRTAGAQAVQPYLWLLPVALLVVGVFSAFQNWFIRRRQYAGIARARAAQSLGAASVQIGAGLAGAGPIGLIAGVVLNGGTGAAMMLRSIAADIRSVGGWPNVRSLKQAARDYSRFPLYSTWEALANSMAVQVPVLLVAALTSASELGQLLMALNVVQAPLALFGNATAQVFLSQAPTKAREGLLGQFTRQTVWNLLRAGTPMMAAIAFLAPWVFPLMFGPNWQRAGILAAWMTPWMLMQFAYGPVSMVFQILGRQRLAMLVQIFGLLLRVGMTWAGGILLAGRASEFYALSGMIFYGLAILLIFFILPRPNVQIV